MRRRQVLFWVCIQCLLLSSALARSIKSGGSHSKSHGSLKVSHGRPKIKLFIGLPSDRRHRHHRIAARETWMRLAAQTNEVVVKFFVSHDGKDANMTGELHLENKQHGDMVILEPNDLVLEKALQDGIPGVTQKMSFLFEMAVTEYNPDFVARIDDDAFVNIPVIMHMIAKNVTSRPWWFGFPIRGAQIDERETDGLRLFKYQSYVDDLVHPPIVPQYMNGALVIISASAVEALVAVNKIIGLRMLWDDDVAIGLWLASFDMKMLSENEAGCQVQPYRPKDFGLIEWDDAPYDNFCLDAQLPYAVVHPCKDPDMIRRIFETAMECGDPIAPGMPVAAASI